MERQHNEIHQQLKKHEEEKKKLVKTPDTKAGIKYSNMMIREKNVNIIFFLISIRYKMVFIFDDC